MSFARSSPLALACLMTLLQGCAPVLPSGPEWWTFHRGRLGPSDLEVAIPGLGPATDAPDRTLRLCSGQPVVVVVHGCRGSAGRFRALAEVFAFHGQQAVAFSYDDRESLRVVARRLNQALGALSQATQGQPLLLLGHSQGGLISRAALVAPLDPCPSRLELVTIATPFAGVRAADHCGSRPLMLLSAGLVAPICQLVTGSKWREITRTSSFIRSPGTLSPQVLSHLMLVTDERGSCRRQDVNGRCVESDDVFTLEEQRHPVLEEDPRVRLQMVKAGHVEIAGDHRMAPRKLIVILQERGLLNPTPPSAQKALDDLLARLYGESGKPLG